MRAFLLSCLLAIVSVCVGCQNRPAAETPVSQLETATFALGCYWCAQHAFDGIEGTAQVTAGHAGDGVERREAVEVRFDPRVVTYEALLEHFWLNVDPLDPDGQFCDRGSEYRSGIFVHDQTQRMTAQASKTRTETQKGFEIVTPILDAGESFEPVRESEQFYYRKQPVRYRFYRTNCGRDARLHELWGERAGGTSIH